MSELENNINHSPANYEYFEFHDHELKTPVLLEAVQTGNKEITNLLLDYGVQVNKTISSGDWMCSLHCAVAKGNKEVTKLLLNRGADVNLEEKGKTVPSCQLNKSLTKYASY